MRSFSISTIGEWETFIEYIAANNTSSSSEAVVAELTGDLDFTDYEGFYPYISGRPGTIYNININGDGHSIIKAKFVGTSNDREMFPVIGSALGGNCAIENIIFDDCSFELVYNNAYLIVGTGGTCAARDVIFKNCSISATLDVGLISAGEILRCTSQSIVSCRAYLGFYCSGSISFCGLCDDIKISVSARGNTSVCFAGSTVANCFSRCKVDNNGAENCTFRVFSGSLLTSYCAMMFENTPDSYTKQLTNSRSVASCLYDTDLENGYTWSEYFIAAHTSELQSKAYLKSKGWLF